MSDKSTVLATRIASIELECDCSILGAASQASSRLIRRWLPYIIHEKRRHIKVTSYMKHYKALVTSYLLSLFKESTDSDSCSLTFSSGSSERQTTHFYLALTFRAQHIIKLQLLQ